MKVSSHKLPLKITPNRVKEFDKKYLLIKALAIQNASTYNMLLRKAPEVHSNNLYETIIQLCIETVLTFLQALLQI